MLRAHKNGFVDIIKEEGFGPELFTSEERSNEFIISLKETPLHFIASNLGESYYLYRVGYTLFGPKYPFSGWDFNEGDLIENVYKTFRYWLTIHVSGYLKEQLDLLLLPDQWNQIELQKPIMNGSAIKPEDVLSLTDDEKAQLKLSIDEFGLLIEKTFQPTREEMLIVNNRLDYLSKAVERLNRIDWRALAIETVISISIALSLDTERGRTLFELFRQVFSHVIHLLK
jgi:hypothetical protein